jgi:hypothetical protein
MFTNRCICIRHKHRCVHTPTTSVRTNTYNTGVVNFTSSTEAVKYASTEHKIFKQWGFNIKMHGGR